MSEIVNVPEIAKRIAELHSLLKNGNTPDEIGNKINDILIYADKVPCNILSGAWDLFAKRKGVSI